MCDSGQADKLVEMASGVDEYPTLVQLDSMLTNLSKLPRSSVNLAIADDMLEMRSMIVAAGQQ